MAGEWWPFSGWPAALLQLVLMPVALPFHRAAGIVKGLARRQQIQVVSIGVQAAAELPGVGDVPVPRDHPAHTGHGGEPPQARSVGSERIFRERVQDWYLDVGEHVAGHEDPSVRDEHRAVARRVPVMDDHLRGRAIPRDVVRAAGQRYQPADQVQVVAGCGALGLADHRLAFGLSGRHGARCRVPGDIAEVAAPEDMIPVRMGREADPRPQARAVQVGGGAARSATDTAGSMTRHPPSWARTAVLVHVSSCEVATRTPGAISRKRCTPPSYSTTARSASSSARDDHGPAVVGRRPPATAPLPG